MKKNKVIFLDRDGTINKDTGHTHKIEDLEFEKNAIKGLRLVKEKLPDYKIIIITNQAGIGKGYYSEETFHKFMEHMNKTLKKEGIIINDYYFCPHHQKKGIEKYKILCECRKPEPGMLKKAILEHDIDVSKSYMIGDKWADIKAGNLACLKTILVMTGNKGGDEKNKIEPNYIGKDLKDAINFIISHKN
jgi:D,D-heptose 1,7-bisphosphate phosphatase